jgi:peptidoglycan/xylan/chitin deacetylase (PgdA/CDA1 family)
MGDTLRRVVKVTVAGLLHYSGLLRFLLFFQRAIQGKKVTCVLGLHRVLSASQEAQANSLGSIVLREETFAKMLGFLSRDFALITLHDFMDGGDGSEAAARPRCLLTFDDGWRDNYTTAYPWLKKYSTPAAIFLATGMIDGNTSFWVEQLCKMWKDGARRAPLAALGKSGLKNDEESGPEATIEFLKHMSTAERTGILSSVLPREDSDASGGDRMLTWSEVEEMKSGGIEFASHTVSHPLLTYEKDEDVLEELSKSRQIVAEKLGAQVKAFAYPNGDWDDRVRRLVKKAGYSCAFTTRPGWHQEGDDPFVIRRILIHEGNVTGWKGRFSPAVFRLTLARGG